MRVYVFALAVSLSYLFYCTSAWAQSPSPRDKLVEAIKLEAEQDAKSEKPPMSVADLDRLFGEEAAKEGLPLLEVRKIYHDAYLAAKPEKSWWHTFLPQAGWITAVLLFIILFFRDALKDLLSARIRALSERVYNRIAGYKVFHPNSLKKYRKAVVVKNERFKIPFRSDWVLDMKQIYVPLKVKGANDTDQIDDLEAIRKYRRLMVLGAPGSGKSMLLRRLTLAYATGSLRDNMERLIPILLDLRRLNQIDKPIIDHLVDVFALNGFSNARNFVESNLELGKLLLLFDGLDEINSVQRANEVSKIRDLLDRFGNCPAVITCRSAVYRKEFSEYVQETLEIVEFADQQIQKFLASWPDIPENKSIAQLLLSLRERPRIMALARNPLLLTIIAFLSKYRTKACKA